MSDDKVLKHCTASQPHVRKLKIKGGKLYWGWKSIPIKTISHLSFGKSTTILQRSDNSVDPKLCVSITTTTRAIDYNFTLSNKEMDGLQR